MFETDQPGFRGTSTPPSVGKNYSSSQDDLESNRYAGNDLS